MKAVATDLPLALLHDDLPTEGLPACGARKLRAQHAQKKQADSLAEQMRIGRKISRKIALEVASVAAQAAQPLVAKVGQSASPFQQVIAPKPGETSKCRFQTAGPIDADGVGIVGLPLPPLPQHFVDKPGIARQPVGLRESDEVLMAIQLPRDLAITHFVEIQIAHLVKQLLRSSLPVNKVEMPVNYRAIVEIFVAQQVEAMLADFLRLVNDPLSLAGKPLAQQRQQSIDRIEVKEKISSVAGRRTP